MFRTWSLQRLWLCLAAFRGTFSISQHIELEPLAATGSMRTLVPYVGRLHVGIGSCPCTSHRTFLHTRGFSSSQTRLTKNPKTQQEIFFSAGAHAHVLARSLDMKQKQQLKFYSSELATLLEVTLPEGEETSFVWPTKPQNITFKKVSNKLVERRTSERTIRLKVRADACIVLPNDTQTPKASCNKNEISSTPPPRQSRMADPLSDGRHEATVNGAQR
jgi:hypothetical protein